MLWVAAGDEESDEEAPDGLTALEHRRQKRAAGDHPLQESFREASARLLAKYGIQAPPGEEAEELGEEEEEEEEGSEDGGKE